MSILHKSVVALSLIISTASFAADYNPFMAFLAVYKVQSCKLVSVDKTSACGKTPNEIIVSADLNALQYGTLMFRVNYDHDVSYPLYQRPGVNILTYDMNDLDNMHRHDLENVARWTDSAAPYGGEKKIDQKFEMKRIKPGVASLEVQLCTDCGSKVFTLQETRSLR
jgi:hypothetical protein